MKRFIALAAIAAILASCSSSGAFVQPSLGSVEQALKNLCNCVLPAQTAAAEVAAVISTLNPIIVTASGVATLICNAVGTLPPSSGLRAAAPVLIVVVVNGVPVHVIR